MDSKMPARRPSTIAQVRKDRYMRELAKVPATPTEQLTLFDQFVANTPAEYTNILEFWDAVPKFALTVQTSFKKGASLAIQKLKFVWGEVPCSVTITPVVVESSAPDKDGNGSTSDQAEAKDEAGVRKEVLPGPREETIYRVLKKMAADPDIKKIATDKGVSLKFTLHQLRSRLRAVSHEYRVVDLKEGLEVLNRSVLSVVNERTKKRIYGGSYIDLKYVSVDGDETGEASIVTVRFNDLAVASVTSGLYDRIHYERLMSLRPLSAWIYELLTRNFRQAGADHGFTLSLSRILRESGLPPRKDLRSNLRMVRDSITELESKGVLTTFPPTKEEIQYSGSGSRGRKAIKEVIWTLYPSPDVVKDIRIDNAEQLRRREAAIPIR